MRFYNRQHRYYCGIDLHVTTMYVFNGLELLGTIDEHERLMLDLAAGHLTREQLSTWLQEHVNPVVL